MAIPRPSMKKKHKYTIIGAAYALASLAVGADLSTTVTLVALAPAVIITCFYGYTLAGKFKSRG